MAKNILQDIKPLTSNARRIQTTSERVSPLPKKEVENYIQVEEDEHVDTPEYNDNVRTPRSRSRGFIWTIVIVVLLVLCVALSYAFEGATITVTPKEETVMVENTFRAERDAGDGELAYEVTALSGEESKTFTGTEKRTANDKATGTVIIYNEFSTAPQPLLIDTRLVTKDGKIYKTVKAVKVPGFTTKAGDTIPGSIEVGVYADVAGPEYNIAPSDFSILGFKGSPKYTKVYARSKGSISGGSKGELYTLTAEEKTKAKTELIAALKDKLMKQAISQVPDGFVYYDGGIFLSVDESALTFEGASSTITGTAKGKISVLLFDEVKLTQAIAKEAIRDYDGLPVTIPELRDLKLAPKGNFDSDPTALKDISFTLAGNAHVMWQVDGEKLKGDLAGKDKKGESQLVLEEWKAIDTAEIVIRPFWKQSLPDNTADIKVIVTAGEGGI